MSEFRCETYGPIFNELLNVDRCRPLGAGPSNKSAYAGLKALTSQRAFAHHAIVDQQMADLCCAATWLVHDYLDESHRISQSVDTSSGSYWHGIMHRREGDYSNAKYWFRRTGDHFVFMPLVHSCAELAQSRGTDEAQGSLVTIREWDPYLFVDLCEAAELGRSTDGPFCCLVQQREWELLFDYCYRNAIGEG